MAQLNNLIVTGSSRFLNKIYGYSATYSSDIVVGDTTNNIQIVGQMLDISNTLTWDGSNLLLKSAIQSARSTVLQKYSPSNGVYNILTSGVASNTQDEITFTNKAYYLKYDTNLHALTLGSRKENTTNGLYSLSSGYNNTASGYSTSSLGNNCVSSGDYSVSCGYTCTASSSSTFAGGNGSTASSSEAFAFGNSCTSSGQFSVTFGNECTATNTCSYAEGYLCECSGSYSHAEGYSTKVATNAAFSHAEGYYSETSHSYTHAEGYLGKASGEASHAEGFRTEASGIAAHSEGYATVASGYYSHAQGYYNTANHRSQHVFGEYCIADPSTASSSNRGTYVEIVGNGDNDTDRSNARTLDWSGNEVLAGNLTLSGTASDIVLSGTNNTWDGMNTSLKAAIGGQSLTFYGTCTTAAGTVAKAVTCAAFITTMADCPVGTTVRVKFTNGNTATNPTLNVNSKGAIAILKHSGEAPGTTKSRSWRDASIVDFTYDGTNWIMNDVNDFAFATSVVTENPSSSSNYWVTFVSDSPTSTGSYSQKGNDGFKYFTREGTTSAYGYGCLILGNNINQGTAGNKYGALRLFSKTGSYYTQLNPTENTSGLSSNITLTLPNVSGTVLNTGNTSFTQVLTSGTEIAQIKLNGTTTSIYAPNTTTSSRLVKKNIEPVSSDEVNKLLQLNAVKFDFKKSESNNQAERGFIAEEVKDILPCIYHDEVKNEKGEITQYASINYTTIIPLLVELCKQQQKEIDELISLIRK